MAVKPFAAATACEQVDSHTYRADFAPDWVIGTVPHGGYVTACFLTVVRKHFDTTLKKQNQPHTIASHLDFLRRTQTGPATFIVKDVKLGRQTTIVHVTLSQEDREEVVGYFTNSNIRTEAGVTYSTNWQLHPQPLPVPDFAALEAGTDPNWGERKEWPFSEFRKAASKIRSWFPRQGQHSPACLDIWFQFRDPGSRFTNESLGFILDTFPQILEQYTLDGLDPYSVDFEKRYSQEEQKRIMNHKARMWYPTLLLNLEIKKALPEEGVKWLFIRLQAKSIKNGRYDLEVLAMDPEGDLVAVSNHVCFAVGSERNMAARRKVDEGGSKL
ncbi:uncharacterized protein LTR77_002065 [Saxophila tyrrhenica]|uniref:Thioesterase-like superfamily-domain-containing protein n=1 Tax=Saxophila tyrrhenica TaxID=1690608 RepID=A0AAV9PHH4_9PEZI|nr:hypothetical protein LTR77_002065 [Saxophila tyrrhenica]